MAWRFKASKYKNAAPIVPKPEATIRDIIVGSYQNYGSNIAASAAFMAFNWEHTGTSLAVLPIDDCGRKSKTMPLLHAHSDTVTDLEFSPFHDGILATGSQDCLVKIWHIPPKGLTTSITNPECTFSHKQRRIERVGFHPTADCLLHSTSAGTINLWDITVQEEAFSNNEHPEVIQSVSWKKDGTTLATTCKDKMIRIVDPRANNPITMAADSHQSIKDSRVVWLGEQNRILTTGFDAQRLRQVIIRDVRNFSCPEKTLELDCSTGILMPLFDSDTNMLFLAGKGDSTISYLEVTEKEPHLIEGLRHTGEQTKGACLVPKRALRVMEGEVNRILQLTSNSVIPIMYQVPRKTYRDFHSDLYPDTCGFKTDLSAAQWLKGTNMPVPKMSLDPAKRELGVQPIVVHRGNLMEMIENVSNKTRCAATEEPKKLKETPMIKTAYIPIKDKIKHMEEYNKTPIAAEKCDSGELKNDENGKEPEPDIVVDLKKCTESNGEAEHSDDDHVDRVTEISRQAIIPPTPLPRTSRTNSVSDYSSEDSSSGGSASCPPRPSPRPRITAVTVGGGYKPRLGPKPFVGCTSSQEFSFDKVFSVPQVPGTEQPSANGPNADHEKTDQEKVDQEKTVEEQDSPASNTDQEKMDDNSDEKTDASPELESTECDPPVEASEVDIPEAKEPEVPEIRGSEAKKSEESEEDRSEGATSIAERRKLYEHRSLSIQDEKAASPTPLRRRNSLKQWNGKEDDHQQTTAVDVDSASNAKTGKRTSTVFGRVSKYRHLKGTPGHKSTSIENVRNISRQLPGECDGFHGNAQRIAVPLAGAGGKIAIYELSKCGRLPDGVIPSLVNGANIMDFQWDPFNSRRLAVACDDGIVRLWIVPVDGLTEPINTPQSELVAHSDKIYFIKFHPCASDVFLTASYDMTVKLWDLSEMKECIVLQGHTDQIFSFAWSPCGVFGATVCRDGRLRVYNPRKSPEPIAEGPGPVGTRGARVVWALDGEFIVVTGFDKVSERQISIYQKDNLGVPLNTIGIDVSPAILVPFYDEDSSTLFVTGKGDSTVFGFEITDEAPHICPLSHHRSGSVHQGLSFLSKDQCNVAIVEFAKALRLTNNTVEWLSFTVPRIKSELFQDDLFPPTRVTWAPSLCAKEWFSGKDKAPARISLQPEGMACLSSSKLPTGKPGKDANPAPSDAIPPPHPGASMMFRSDVTKQREKDIQKSLSARMEPNLSKIEYDTENGVDEDEWEG
ncbi:coronin-7 isoform X1 [Lutzomyia longipalpis]|uniref:coronin-7 isoform X1 n=1 Tax=Lutzomyia longipalpis TaxID=7200 RepID=UPI0024844804|nr:coronin-7 isoform X1 [Lutzomyia longipalpis]